MATADYSEAASGTRGTKTKIDSGILQQHRFKVFKFTFCKYFFRGKCTRGSACTFAHGVEELRERPQLSKTRICEKWRQGACEHANPENCRFAHGKDDLRIAKPGICDLHRQGLCAYGENCRFAHNEEEVSTQLILLSSNKTPLEVHEAVQGAWNKLRKSTVSHSRQLKEQAASTAPGAAVNEPPAEHSAAPAMCSKLRLSGGAKKVSSRLAGRSGISATPGIDPTRFFGSSHIRAAIRRPSGTLDQAPDPSQPFRNVKGAALEPDICVTADTLSTEQIAPGFMEALAVHSPFRASIASPALLPAAALTTVGADHRAAERAFSRTSAAAAAPRVLGDETSHGTCKPGSRNARVSAANGCLAGPACRQPSSSEGNWRTQTDKEKGLLQWTRTRETSPKPTGQVVLQHRQLSKQRRGIAVPRRPHESRGLSCCFSPRSMASVEASGSTDGSGVVFSTCGSGGGKGVRQISMTPGVTSFLPVEDGPPHVTISPPAACLSGVGTELYDGNCVNEATQLGGDFPSKIVSGSSRKETAGPPSTMGDCDSTEVGPSEQGRSETMCPSLSPSAETLSSGCYGPSGRDSLSPSPVKNRSTSRGPLKGQSDSSHTPLSATDRHVVGHSEGEDESPTVGCGTVRREMGPDSFREKKQEGQSAQRSRPEPWVHEAKRPPPRSPKQRVPGTSAHAALLTSGRGQQRKQREDGHYQDGAHRLLGLNTRKGRQQHQRVKRDSHGTFSMSRRGAVPSDLHLPRSWRQIPCSDLPGLPDALLLSPANVTNHADKPLTGRTFTRRVPQHISSLANNSGVGCVLPQHAPPEALRAVHQSYPGTPNSALNPLADPGSDKDNVKFRDLREMHLPPAAFHPSSSFLYPKHGDADAAPVVVMPSTIRNHQALDRLQHGQQQGVPHIPRNHTASLTPGNGPPRQESSPGILACCPGTTPTGDCGSAASYSTSQILQSDYGAAATTTDTISESISETGGRHEVGLGALWVGAPETVSPADCLGPPGNFALGIEPYNEVRGTKGPVAEDTAIEQDVVSVPGFSIGCDFPSFLPVSALGDGHSEVACANQFFDGSYFWSWVNYHDMIRYFCIQMGQKGTADLLNGAASRADYTD